MAQTIEYLLGFCVAVDTETKSFVSHDAYGNPNFSELRAEGFAAAYTGDFVKTIVLFGPVHETEVMSKELQKLEVPDSAILERETLVSTIGNGEIMQKFMTEYEVEPETAVMSSSGYHIRAPFFGYINGLRLQFVPAEAYIFAKADKEAGTKIAKELCKTFGDCPMAVRLVSEIRGFGDFIAERYTVPQI